MMTAGTRLLNTAIRFSTIRFFLVGVLFLVTFAAQASDVCRSSQFQGMSANKIRAESVLPPTTTSTMKQASVYVEYDKGVLYYHSNFITRGLGEDGKPLKYPTKVTGDPNQDPVFADPASVFLNVVFAEMPDSGAANAARRALKEDVQLLLDVSMFDDAGIPRIDLTGVKNVHLVDAGRKQSLAISLETMQTSKPPPSIIAKIKGCCLYGRPPHWSRRFAEELSKRPFESRKVKFASLFIESATDREIARSNLVKGARVKGDSSQLKSEVELKKILDDARGSTLVLLGHVEGADYVMRTSGNVEQLRIPIASVRAMARASGVQLIDIGCQTTKAIKEESFGLGVMTRYNSVEAVKSLERALATSRTFEDFLVNFSSKGLKIVLEPSFLKDPVKTASVYSRIRDASKAAWVKVAQVTFSHFN